MTSDPARRRLRRLWRRPISRQLLRAAQEIPCHLVGGALRDQALGEPLRDLDVVVEQGGRLVAERLSALTAGRLVDLGDDRFAAFRVVLPDLIVDLWDRQGAPLESDLSRRDFTVNSFALELRSGGIVDPVGGLLDLRRRLLRSTSEGAFENDPLRVVRLARLAGQLRGFSVEPATLLIARRAAPDLARVAPERVRQELDLLLQTGAAGRWLEVLVELSLYPQLWSGHAGPADRTQRAFATLAELEGQFGRLSPGRPPAIDLAAARMALLFDRLPAAAEDDPIRKLERFQERGFLTRRAAQRVADLLEWRRLPLAQSDQRWFLHRTGRQWPTALCCLGARLEDPGESPRWPRVVEDLLRLEAAAGGEIFDPPPLLDGGQVQRLLGCPPGPEVGHALRLLRRRQIEGEIRTRREAEDFVRRCQGPS